MKLVWSNEAWDDYIYWQTQDIKTLQRINDLIKLKVLGWLDWKAIGLSCEITVSQIWLTTIN